MMLLLASFSAIAQPFTLSGKMLDDTDNSTLIGVSLVLLAADDSTKKNGAVTDAEGRFLITGIEAGRYTLKASYIGFQTYNRTLNITEKTDLGTIRMSALSTQLKNVTVTAQQTRATQSGDTSSFNANAFKTNPDATAQDLINKMPGITSEGGTVKVNGEEVRQILVDGKPFFGDDPNAAIKNLPAEIIERIQVFDRLSDQAQLTGFIDGNEQRTINIITKPGRNAGQFGKIYGGYGARTLPINEHLYMGGGNINYFKGNTRLSLIALSNNVNQQNFSSDDLMGVVNPAGGQSSGGGASRGGGRSGRGGGDAGNFLVGQQPGITTTHSIGINYSDEWTKGMKVTGSYFFNNTRNENTNNLTRNYFGGADSNLSYKEQSSTISNNTNHRANLRIEYDIDSNNAIIFTPRISYQQNENNRNLLGDSKYSDGTLLNNTNNTNASRNDGYNLAGNLTYRHKFARKGRTISLNINSSVNNRLGDGYTYSLNSFANLDSNTVDSNLLDQRYDLKSNSRNLSANLTYTEPLTEKSQLMLSYNPSVSSNNSDREVKNRQGTVYNDLDPELSNKFENTYNTQRGGLTYQLRDEQINFTAGINYQKADLKGTQFFPQTIDVNRSFTNVLPTITFNYRFHRNKNLRIMYRTNTSAPSINQLQRVLDITNPIIVRTGNANLDQNYTHNLTLRYNNTNTTTSRNFFAVLFASYVKDYIANETIFPTRTIAFGETFVLTEGSQITRPVNLDGYFSSRGFVTYGLPIRTLKSNVNLNLGVNYNRLPGRIRYVADTNELYYGTTGISNRANNYTFSGGAVLSSNIGEQLDFTLSYSGNYTIVRNSVQTQSNNNFYNHTASLQLNYIHRQRIVWNTSANQLLFSGLSQGFNQSFFLWNAAVGYKFFADRSLDVRLNIYDILNQNRAIERTVTETFIEDSYTNVLRRYFMLQATYTMRRFAGSNSKGTNTTDLVPPFQGRQRERGE